MTAGLIVYTVVFDLRGQPSDGTGKAGHIRRTMIRMASGSTLPQGASSERWI